MINYHVDVVDIKEEDNSITSYYFKVVVKYYVV